MAVVRDYAIKYFHKHYRNLMSAYSIFYNQLSVENDGKNEEDVVIQAAKYTTLAHMRIVAEPLLQAVEDYIKQHGDPVFDDFETQLIRCIIIESELHDLEKCGFITISNSNESRTVEITAKGRRKLISLTRLDDCNIP